MDNMKIKRLLERALRDIGKLMNNVSALYNLDSERDPEGFEKLSGDTALQGEKTSCRLRHLVYTTPTLKRDYLVRAAEAMNISVSCDDGIVRVKLPALIPKRHKHVTEFITDPLHYALATRDDLPYFEKCVVCFVHYFSDRRGVLDYDNMECKAVLDVVASHVMRDDSGLFCDVYSTAKLGNTNRTEIVVMEPSRFSDWLNEGV